MQLYTPRKYFKEDIDIVDKEFFQELLLFLIDFCLVLFRASIEHFQSRKLITIRLFFATCSVETHRGSIACALLLKAAIAGNLIRIIYFGKWRSLS